MSITGTGIPSSLFALQLLKQFLGMRLDSATVVTSSPLTTESLISDLNAWSNALGVSVDLVELPGWAESPYLGMKQSSSLNADRTRALARVFSPKKKPTLFIGSLSAFLQATTPVTFFKENTVTLSLNMSFASREDFLSQLRSLGYVRVDVVEDVGTFSVRGEVIDLFPPNLENPIRVVFFDTEIEQIRPFSVLDQMTPLTTPLNEDPFGSLQSVSIYQAKELLLLPRLDCLRKNLKLYCDDNQISKAKRDHYIEEIQSGLFDEQTKFWAPFAFESPECAFDYFSQFPLFVFDLENCLAHFTKLKTSWTSDSLMEESKKRIIPTLDQLFLTRDWIKNITTTPHDINSQVYDFKSTPGNWDTALRHLSRWVSLGIKPYLFFPIQTREESVAHFLQQRGFQKNQFTWVAHSLTTGLESVQTSLSNNSTSVPICALTETQFYGSKARKKSRVSSKLPDNWAGVQSLSEITGDDLVVHSQHGICKYRTLQHLKMGEFESDFLLLEFKGGDKLYLPVYRLNLIQKYYGDNANTELDQLGSSRFHKAKTKAAESARILAVNLIQIHATRTQIGGIALPPTDSLYSEFAARFPFEETPDQLTAVESVMLDLQSGRPMDRVICGDVGFGKTEIAIRAAFRVVSAGYQVAILVPTTLLCLQHEQSFKERFKDYPISIDSLSRFKTAKDQATALENLEKGKTDIIIGTHRLLSKDVEFSNLGLVVVDEEHRFGVEHKERLKTLRESVHLLSLSATPIPRTLQMALSGIREISLLRTPPIERSPIKTVVCEWNDHLIKTAIMAELERGGQVYFVNNRVHSLGDLYDRLVALLPPVVTIAIAHGQMPERELEDIMKAFYNRKIHVLLATAIVESGLDVRSANTLFIDRADLLGLSQLYQLRGRVGRSDVKAVAYLLVPESGQLTADAKKRVGVIERFANLGAGFDIASHDLEIRGGGDLLGAQQSGHVSAVGYEMYLDLLEEAVSDLKVAVLPDALRGRKVKQRDIELSVPYKAYLPDSYLPDLHLRLNLYRRLASCSNDQALLQLEQEMVNRFGPIPVEGTHLLWVLKIKLLLNNTTFSTLRWVGDSLSLQRNDKSKLVIKTQATSLAALYAELSQELGLSSAE